MQNKRVVRLLNEKTKAVIKCICILLNMIFITFIMNSSFDTVRKSFAAPLTFTFIALAD